MINQSARSERVMGVKVVTTIRVTTVVALLLAYEGIARSGLLYEGVAPSLSLIGGALISLLGSEEFYAHFGISAWEIVAGFGMGLLAGLALGLALGTSRLLGDAVNPWVHYLAPTPKIIFFPILVLAFGSGIGSKIAMGAISAFFPVVVSTFAAVRQIRPVLLKVARTYQASSWQTLRLVYLPSLYLPLLSAARIALGAAIIGTLLAETKMSRSGMGFLIIQEYNFFRMPEMYSLLIIVILAAWLINAGMDWMARLATRNRPS